MKTIKILNYVFVIALGFFAVMFGISRFGNKNSQNTGDATLYTEEFCQDIIGFNGVIPLEINMKAGKIASINILENKETPRFLKKVSANWIFRKKSVIFQKTISPIGTPSKAPDFSFFRSSEEGFGRRR